MSIAPSSVSSVTHCAPNFSTDAPSNGSAAAGVSAGVRAFAFFGGSVAAFDCALAALVAAAELPQDVAAVVSRGGRPDLAGDALPKVQAPTLLIVGGNDDIVIELNEMARDQIRCEVKLEIIPDATHLFEEPGALEQVAKLASDWFSLHLGPK